MTLRKDTAALRKAEKEGRDWLVLPPQRGYPFEELGWRLMRRIGGDYKSPYDRWVCILIGGQQTLKHTASEQEAVINCVPRLKEK